MYYLPKNIQNLGHEICQMFKNWDIMSNNETLAVLLNMEQHMKPTILLMTQMALEMQ